MYRVDEFVQLDEQMPKVRKGRATPRARREAIKAIAVSLRAGPTLPNIEAPAIGPQHYMQHKDEPFDSEDVFVPRQPVPFMVEVKNAKLVHQPLPAGFKQACETLLLNDVTKRKVSVVAADGKIVTAELLMSGTLDLGPAALLSAAVHESVEELARLKILFALLYHGHEEAAPTGDVLHFPFLK